MFYYWLQDNRENYFYWQRIFHGRHAENEKGADNFLQQGTKKLEMS